MECAAMGCGNGCVRGLASRRCGLCGAVAYCSIAHQMSHWKAHKDECERFAKQMKHADILSDFPFTFSAEAASMSHLQKKKKCSFLMSKCLHFKGLWKSECNCRSSSVFSNDSWRTDGWELQSALCPCSDPRSPLSTRLNSWRDYYKWRGLPFHSPVSLLLHWPLTIYHCFQLAAMRGFEGTDDKLNIHYLGPEKELGQLAVFSELRALFPEFKVHMEFIGPAVPESRNGETIHLINYASCSERRCCCQSQCSCSRGTEYDREKSAVVIRLNKGFYHEIFKDISKLSEPHLIVAPNAGVAAYPSWLSTIKLIKDMNSPAIFTDFCEEAANLAAHCIANVTNAPLDLPVQVNPFRQPMVVENSSLFLPCYSNCFLFGINVGGG